ncbi:NAD-dependent epimerase/dehydratase family protein [Streptomyces sp. NPDC000151]|uniref:NAD-dependent epimerase/dehydratase family protein n=1 Tax=Streptomyces sp. NPDC000151 TaxID=3154244 RepID=UPI003326627D
MSSVPERRVVVTGATGNVGTSVVRVLSEDPQIDVVHCIARRTPRDTPPKTTWTAADIADEECDLAADFAGAAAVVHLAWAFQPTHHPPQTWRTNVLGSLRVFEATARAGVPALVHASSVGAYSPGPKDHKVDESWPTHGWPDAAYCREKAYLERVLDGYEREHPGMRVVRMRPAFLFKEEAASEQRRIFGGPAVPAPVGRLARPGLLPFLPDVPGLRFQVLHTDDAARAYRLAVLGDARGAFNLAAEPPVDMPFLARLLKARTVRMPAAAARAALGTGWRLRLVRASPHLFDAVLGLPLMDCGRAREELGWRPESTAAEAVGALLSGLRNASGAPTPPLSSHPKTA